jgi:capsular exopolysaccharide synthesis family protein
MHIRDQLAVVVGGWRLVLIATIAAAAVAYLVTSSMPKVYEAQAKLIVAQALTTSAPDYNVLLASQRLSQTYAELVTTRPIVSSVIARLSLPDDPQAIIDSTTSQAAANSLYVNIAFRDGDPARAALIANTLATELITAAPAILLSPDSSNSPRLLTVVEPAVSPPDPTSPRVLLTTGLAALAAFVAALAVVVFREHLNDTVRTDHDASEAAGAPALASIERIRAVEDGRPAMYSLATLLYPRSNAAEEFRTLRTNIDFTSLDEPVRSIVVTSSAGSEGKSTVAANLAIAYAQSGRRTILVDGDLRKPSVADLFRLPTGAGLTDILKADEIPLDRVLHKTDEPHLRVLTSGALPPNPAELVGTTRMRSTLARLAEHADVVIIDTPPLAVTDPAVLAAAADGTLLVVRAGRIRRPMVKARRAALERVGARVLGVVLNGVAERGEDYGYYSEPVGAPAPPVTTP